MAEKIGVYFDQSAVGTYLDLDKLVELVQNKWGELCPVVKVHPFLAGDDGISTIKSDIESAGLDGVLICGTSPRHDTDRFNFDNVMIDRVNLREQCVMGFQEADGSVPEPDDEPSEELQKIAKDYVNMGVVKLQKTTIPTPEIPEMNKTILVIGGGYTGLNAALHCSGAGYDVIIAEKENELGGYAAKLHKSFPMSAPFNELRDTGVQDLISRVENDPKITVLTGSTVEALKGAPGTYEAVIGGNSHKVGSVVLAAGWTPEDTSDLEPLGYGKYKNVMTSMEFEEMAKDGNLNRPSDGTPIKTVAFVINTDKAETDKKIRPTVIHKEAILEEAEEGEPEGEEDEVNVIEHKDMETTRHLAYAKHISAMNALKQATYVTDGGGEIAYIFYSDMITMGLGELYYKSAQDTPGVMLTKGSISNVQEDEDGSILLTATETLFGEDVELKVDLLVLPVGIVPMTAKQPVVNFQYRQGPTFPELELFDGFADSNYICFPYETRRTGVYAAGAVRQPMTLDEIDDDAAGAALKAIQCIESANRGMSVHPRSGDLTFPVFNFVRCTQCKRCTEECPFGALDDDEKGTPMPNTTRCRRCGTCMGACPERVISFDNYNVDQIGSMIKQIDVPDEMDVDGPRILVLACENDAYPALDMAAMRGKRWSPYIRVLPVRCLGSVNAIWVADAMSKGVDGVMMLGCPWGDDYQCHFMKGSEICNRRKANIAETLDRLGVDASRVQQYEIAIDDYDKVPGVIEEFINMCIEKGPNPFKGY